ncbi:MAG: hypothetical protein ACOYI9_12400 [Candidatus Hydrogenedentales bacterium]|jgi:hypothetical protein
MTDETSKKLLNRRHFISVAGAAIAGSSIMAAQTPLPDGAKETITASDPKNAPLLCGWATTTITPDKPVQLAGQFAERVSKKVLEPCMANALVMDGFRSDGTPDQAVLVSCDLVHIPKEIVAAVRERVAKDLPELDANKIILAATHTHTGPTMISGTYKDPAPGIIHPEEYCEFFIDQVSALIVDAWEKRQPSGISRAVGHAAVGFNRIMVYADGSMVMYGKTDREDWLRPYAGHDHALELLFTWNQAKELTGIVINIACPSQVVEGQLYVSPDFWGPVRSRLREEFAADLGVLPLVSAAGDQSPRDLVRRGRNEPDMRSEPGMNEMAQRIVNGVRYAMETAQTEVSWTAHLEHHAAPLELPARKVTEEEAAAARAQIEKMDTGKSIDPASPQAALLRRARTVSNRYDTQGDSPTFTMDFHVMRLGDIALATNPFELYLDYGLQIKARSLAAQTFIVQLANDRGAYLPTEGALSGGAYSTLITDNKVGPEGGALLVENTIKAINDMWKD